MLPRSQLTAITVRGTRVLVKRDDLLSLPGCEDDERCRGNKARKLLGLSKQQREADLTVLSYGGLQSNMMAALSALCHHEGWQMHYIVKEGGPVQQQQQQEQQGQQHLQNSNLGRCLAQQHFNLHTATREQYDQIHSWSSSAAPSVAWPTALLDIMPDTAPLLEQRDSQTAAAASLWCPQGGAAPFAEAGCKLLAAELGTIRDEQCSGDEQLDVCIPSGTGTTAALTALHAPPGVNILAVPCVSTAANLWQQMEALADRCGVRGGGTWKQQLEVLDPLSRPPFGHPHKRIYRDWKEIEHACRLSNDDCDDDAELGFDLLYGGAAWNVMLQHEKRLQWSDSTGGLSNSKSKSQLVYVHSGGMTGHESMMQRYARRGLARAATNVTAA